MDTPKISKAEFDDWTDGVQAWEDYLDELVPVDPEPEDPKPEAPPKDE